MQIYTAGTIGSAQTICYNTVPSSFSFTTAPSGGTGTYSYQWYNGSGVISSATNSTYAPAALTATTNYYCLVTSGSCGTVTSNTITITVDANLASGTIGNAQTICYNTVPSSLSFTTAPSGGTGTYSYQWYNGSGVISSATNSTYAPAALTSTTNYYCLVTSGLCGTVTSNTITITVDANLAAGTISSAQTICYNTVPASLTFTTAPSGGTGTYLYQWYNGVGLISLATNSTYAPLALTATTNYYCLVTSGSCGTVTSNTITISVDANLTSGTIGSSQTICYNTVPSSLSFTTAPSGGTGTYSYQWYNGAGLISSSTSSTYAPAALTATTNYYCIATSGTCGTVTSNTITITVDVNLTSGTIGSSQTICYNTVPASLSFTTAPSGGTGTYSYQWYNGAGLISSATNSAYAPSALTATTNYYCLVTSGTCGTVTSNTITITVDAKSSCRFHR